MAKEVQNKRTFWSFFDTNLVKEALERMDVRGKFYKEQIQLQFLWDTNQTSNRLGFGLFLEKAINQIKSQVINLGAKKSKKRNEENERKALPNWPGLVFTIKRHLSRLI